MLSKLKEWKQKRAEEAMDDKDREIIGLITQVREGLIRESRLNQQIRETDNFRKLLKDALKAKTCDFTEGCAIFFVETGFLTPKQVAALESVVKEPYNGEDYYYDGPDIGDNPHG